MSTTNNGITSAGCPNAVAAMTPGQREPGSLTRFAATPAMVETMVDVTMDTAGRTDRQREGGGAPSERRPYRPSRWATMRARIHQWRLRHSSLEATAAAAVVAVNPPVP